MQKTQQLKLVTTILLVVLLSSCVFYPKEPPQMLEYYYIADKHYPPTPPDIKIRTFEPATSNDEEINAMASNFIKIARFRLVVPPRMSMTMHEFAVEKTRELGGHAFIYIHGLRLGDPFPLIHVLRLKNK